MASSRDLRVALAPVEIAGYYANLARGFAELGVACDSLMLKSHAFRYGNVDPAGTILRRALQLTRHFEQFGGRHPAVALQFAGRAAVLAHALRAYDVIVFGYGESFLLRADLPLLKRLGKKLVFVFHGSDSRPPYINGRVVRNCGPEPGPKLVAMTRKYQRKLAWIARYADVIVDNPLSGQLHTRPFINWFRVGLPCAFDSELSPPPAGDSRPLRIVHAPSDPESKGTPLIEAAIDRARARGIEIDFIKLVGRPNAEVHEELVRCDFVIDELYSDVPGAGLAFEAASHGRPTIVGGYAAKAFERWIEPNMVLPTHYCHPGDLDDAVQRLATDAAYRTDLGTRAYHFLRERCAPVHVAERLLRAVTRPDEVRDWLVDPNELSYVRGTGISEAAARTAIRAVIDAGTDSALQLADKPDLLERMKSFADGTDGC